MMKRDDCALPDITSNTSCRVDWTMVLAARITRLRVGILTRSGSKRPLLLRTTLPPMRVYGHPADLDFRRAVLVQAPGHDRRDAFGLTACDGRMPIAQSRHLGRAAQLGRTDLETALDGRPQHVVKRLGEEVRGASGLFRRQS
jgi:hypothetical protein